MEAQSLVTSQKGDLEMAIEPFLTVKREPIDEERREVEYGGHGVDIENHRPVGKTERFIYEDSIHSVASTSSQCDLIKEEEERKFKAAEAAFLTSQYLRDKKQDRSRRFVCTVCLKSFKWAHNLRTHTLIHTGEKPFQCDVCLKRFNQSSSLNTHKLIHTNERPYQCDVCSKKFNQSSSLNTHKLIHSNERPFQCHICLREFSQGSALNKHIGTLCCLKGPETQ